LDAIVGKDWLSQQVVLREERVPTREGGIERTLASRVTHPLVEYARKVSTWQDGLSRGGPLHDADLFRFVSVVGVLRHARTLAGGEAFLSDLVSSCVHGRCTPTTIRAFWDKVFEAEAAVTWSTSGYTIGFGNPGENPDFYFLFTRSQGSDQSQTTTVRVPVECWRASRASPHTEAFEEVWKQLQVKLIRLVRKRGRLLKVAIRAHRDPRLSDVEVLVNEVRRLAGGLEDAQPSWATSSVLEEAFQLCVGDVGPKGLEVRGDHIGNEFFDISAEPPATIYTKARADPDGSHVWIDPRVMALRVDVDPGWLVKHVIENFKEKSEQLRLRNAPVARDPATGGMVACGAVAIHVAPLPDQDLLALDQAIRAEMVQGHKHVSFVVLHMTAPALERSELETGSGKFEVKAGMRAAPYVVTNADALVQARGLDSRAARFGQSRANLTVVDPSSGRLERVIGESDTVQTPLLNTWPPQLANGLTRELNSVQDSVPLIVEEPGKLWTTPGDVLLAQISFGKNELRVVRDQFHNVRALRFGNGSLRDHVAIDIRPFRSASRLIILVSWDTNTWRLGVGSERDGDKVYGRVAR